jgi:hypothetical protein
VGVWECGSVGVWECGSVGVWEWEEDSGVLLAATFAAM